MGRSLEDVWGGAKDRSREAEEAARAANAAAAAAWGETREQLAEMQRGILAGDVSTGDPLQDGVIGIYGKDLYPEIIEKYEKVAMALSIVSEGEPVVAIRRYIKSSGCSGFGGELSYNLGINMAMGLLSGSQIMFDLEQRSSAIPTSRHVYDYWSYFRDADVQGPIQVDSAANEYVNMTYGFRLSHLDEPIRPLAGERVDLPAFELQPVLDTELLIGRDGIREWLAAPDDNLARDRYLGGMRGLAKKLGIAPIEPATKWQESNIEHGRY